MSTAIKKVGKTRLVMLGSIHPRNDDVSGYNKKYMAAMTRAMKEGQISPLWVWQDTREIFDGHHRYAAARKLGWREIRVQFIK